MHHFYYKKNQMLHCEVFFLILTSLREQKDTSFCALYVYLCSDVLIVQFFFGFSGEHVFLDSSTPSLISNQLLSPGAKMTCNLS